MLFDEIYGTYFLIVQKILEAAVPKGLTYRQLEEIILQYGYAETSYQLLPLLLEQWELLEERDGRYFSRLRHTEVPRPISLLEKRWLKALLQDKKLDLFLEPPEKAELANALAEVEELYQPEDITYFNQAADSDPYGDKVYQQHFRKLLAALQEHTAVFVQYQAEKRTLLLTFVPQRFYYSVRDDKLRVWGGGISSNGKTRFYTLNIARIVHVEPIATPKPQALQALLDENAPQSTQKSVTFEIYDKRNTLERCMLDFASYEKVTEYLPEKNCYLCTLYYPAEEETALLIRLLSFGQMLQVLKPAPMRCQIAQRIAQQGALLALE